MRSRLFPGFRAEGFGSACGLLFVRAVRRSARAGKGSRLPTLNRRASQTQKLYRESGYAGVEGYTIEAGAGGGFGLSGSGMPACRLWDPAPFTCPVAVASRPRRRRPDIVKPKPIFSCLDNRFDVRAGVVSLGTVPHLDRKLQRLSRKTMGRHCPFLLGIRAGFIRNFSSTYCARSTSTIKHGSSPLLHREFVMIGPLPLTVVIPFPAA